jgi:hypothetical protein
MSSCAPGMRNRSCMHRFGSTDRSRLSFLMASARRPGGVHRPLNDNDDSGSPAAFSPPRIRRAYVRGKVPSGHWFSAHCPIFVSQGRRIKIHTFGGGEERAPAPLPRVRRRQSENQRTNGANDVGKSCVAPSGARHIALPDGYVSPASATPSATERLNPTSPNGPPRAQKRYDENAATQGAPKA